MSLKHAANHLAAHGRGPDTELVHMTKGEINSLQTLAKANGGSLTINPDTGLPEAGFLSNILPVVAGAAAMYFTGGTAAPLIAGMSNAATIGLGMGALQTARTGSLEKGLMAGMGAYGGAGLAGGLMGTGAAEIGAQATKAAGYTPEIAYGTPLSEVQGLQQSAVQTAGPSGLLTQGAKTAVSNPSQFAGVMGGAKNLGMTGLAAAAPMLLQSGEPQPQTPVGDNVMPQRLQYNPGAATTPFPQPDVPTYGSGMGQNFGRQQNYFPTAGYQNITPEQAKQMRGYADGGGIQYPPGEPVIRMADGGLNLAGEYSRGLPSDLDSAYKKAERKSDKATMRSVKSESELRERLKNPKVYAGGGLSALGDYSDGGRLLKGPGDGVSDSIPATIGNKRPARLADGEFVVPARIVSELGNGSTEAGARKLYAMLDRVQSARKKSIGKGKVAKNSRADKLLPA
jgi:hypothetical protein